MQGLLHGRVCLQGVCAGGRGREQPLSPAPAQEGGGHSLEQEGEGTHSPKERKGQPADRATRLFLKAVGDQAEAG